MTRLICLASALVLLLPLASGSAPAASLDMPSISCNASLLGGSGVNRFRNVVIDLSNRSTPFLLIRVRITVPYLLSGTWRTESVNVDFKYVAAQERRTETRRFPTTTSNSVPCQYEILDFDVSPRPFEPVVLPTFQCSIVPSYDVSGNLGGAALVTVVNGRTGFTYLEIRPYMEDPAYGYPGLFIQGAKQVVREIQPHERRDVKMSFPINRGTCRVNLLDYAPRL